MALVAKKIFWLSRFWNRPSGRAPSANMAWSPAWLARFADAYDPKQTKNLIAEGFPADGRLFADAVFRRAFVGFARIEAALSRKFRFSVCPYKLPFHSPLPYPIATRRHFALGFSRAGRVHNRKVRGGNWGDSQSVEFDS